MIPYVVPTQLASAFRGMSGRQDDLHGQRGEHAWKCPLLTVKAHLDRSYTRRQLHRAKPLDALRATETVVTGLKLPQPRSDPGFKKSQR